MMIRFPKINNSSLQKLKAMFTAIEILEHSWIDDWPLSSYVMATLPQNLEFATVVEMWIDSGWKWEVINHFLSSWMSQRLASLRLVDDQDAQDKIYWGLSESRIYSSKSVWRLIRGVNGSGLKAPLWKLIWKINYCWKCRNHLAFEGSEIIDSLAEAVCNQNFHYIMPHSIDNKIRVQPGEKPPPPKGNPELADEASKGNPGLAGGGGLLRTADGSLMKAYSFSMGSGRALSAELLTIWHGLKLDKQLYYTHLVVETDSSEAYKLLSTRSMLTHADFFLINRCWRMLDDNGWTIQDEPHLYNK
ncbi:hypothetical protein V2J09_004524 [Rumex salicifolius]